MPGRLLPGIFCPGPYVRIAATGPLPSAINSLFYDLLHYLCRQCKHKIH